MPRDVGHFRNAAARLDEQCGDGRERAVEENLARDEQRGILAVELADYKRIDGPYKRRADCQEVTERGKLQDELPVQHHEYHADERDEASENLSPAEPFALVEETAENHDEKWCDADNKRDVTGWRQ